MPRTSVDDSGLALDRSWCVVNDDPWFVVNDDPWCVVNDGPWFVVDSTEMSFTLVQILRHTLHVVDAAVERAQ